MKNVKLKMQLRNPLATSDLDVSELYDNEKDELFQSMVTDLSGGAQTVCLMMQEDDLRELLFGGDEGPLRFRDTLRDRMLVDALQYGDHVFDVTYSLDPFKVYELSPATLPSYNLIDLPGINYVAIKRIIESMQMCIGQGREATVQ